MSDTSPSTDVSVAVRIFMFAAAVFVASAGLSLFLLSESTHLYFAWTIKPPVTASFLGGGYLSVTTALVLGLREHDWAQVRVGVIVVATGLLSILLATLMHLDKFHLGNPVWTAWFWAWSWLVLYIILVPGLVIAVRAQRRQATGLAPSQATLPAWMRLAMRLLGTLMVLMGLLLFAVPGTAEHLWPWPLTPLTARMVGSFYLAFGVSLLAAAREDDYRRISVASHAYLVFAVLQALTILRYRPIDSFGLPAQLLAGVLMALLVIGAAGVVGLRTANARKVVAV